MQNVLMIGLGVRSCLAVSTVSNFYLKQSTPASVACTRAIAANDTQGTAHNIMLLSVNSPAIDHPL